MANYEVTYSAAKDGIDIYYGTLIVSVVGKPSDESIKEAVAESIVSIDEEFGGGVPDFVTVISYLENENSGF